MNPPTGVTCWGMSAHQKKTFQEKNGQSLWYNKDTGRAFAAIHNQFLSRQLGGIFHEKECHACLHHSDL